MGDYFRQTWWLWLIFIIIFTVVGIYVTALFFLFIPGLIGYAIYFGIVRVSEQRNRDYAAARRAAQPKPQQTQT